ncbi:glycerol-3-phosphate 1-O-acyltransferase PlsY [Acidisoma sp. 7E03]
MVAAGITLLALLLGYLLGSINAAVLVGKLWGKDVAAHGSKSAGLTNTLRVLGPAAAAFVLVGDVVKSILACEAGGLIASWGRLPDGFSSLPILAGGLGVVLGHNWPIYFGFRGGKGALAAITVLFVVDWRLASISTIAFLLVVISTRIVSLGTIIAVAAFLVASLLPWVREGGYFYLFTYLISAIVLVKHRTNVRRLLRREESKLGSVVPPSPRAK